MEQSSSPCFSGKGKRRMHKFHLGQAVAYRASRGLYAASGAYAVTAKLPERDGEYEYRIRKRAIRRRNARPDRGAELPGDGPTVARTREARRRMGGSKPLR